MDTPQTGGGAADASRGRLKRFARGPSDSGGDGEDSEDGGGGCGEDAGRKSYGGWGALVVGCSDANRARLKGFGRRAGDGESRREWLSCSARRRRRKSTQRACSDGDRAGTAISI